MKTCTADNCTQTVWGKGYCKGHQWMRKDKKPAVKKQKPIRPISKKLSKLRKTYRELREEFLSRPENQFCAVYPSIPANQVHHKRGRGKYLNDVSTWRAVSDIGHEFIEMHAEIAKERGWSESRLTTVKSIGNK